MPEARYAVGVAAARRQAGSRRRRGRSALALRPTGSGRDPPSRCCARATRKVVPFYESSPRHPEVTGCACSSAATRRRQEARRGARAVPRGREDRSEGRPGAYAVGLLSLQMEEYPRRRVPSRAPKPATRLRRRLPRPRPGRRGQKRYDRRSAGTEGRIGRPPARAAEDRR
jgi:hypothetical protein